LTKASLTNRRNHGIRTTILTSQGNLFAIRNRIGKKNSYISHTPSSRKRQITAESHIPVFRTVVYARVEIDKPAMNCSFFDSVSLNAQMAAFRRRAGIGNPATCTKTCFVINIVNSQ
jgi:hypothetical protein